MSDINWKTAKAIHDKRDASSEVSPTTLECTREILRAALPAGMGATADAYAAIASDQLPYMPKVVPAFWTERSASACRFVTMGASQICCLTRPRQSR